MGNSNLDRFVKKVGGGGFLNNVDGTITGYRLTTVFPGQEGKEEAKREKTPLHVVLSVRLDGAENDVTTTLFGGPVGDFFVISEDERTLTPRGEESVIQGWTGFGKLLTSIFAHDEQSVLNIPESTDNTLNFDFLIGLRVRFVQVVDAYRKEKNVETYTKGGKIGKGVRAKNARDVYDAEGRKKGKDGKFYDEKNLEVNQVYGYVAQAATPAQVAKASAPKAAAPKTTKAAAKAAPVAAAPAEENESIAGRLAVDLLADGPADKTKLNLGITKWFMRAENKPLIDQREAVRALITSDAFLDSLVEAEVITYDKPTKMIALVA